jgi:hypothetical protein
MWIPDTDKIIVTALVNFNKYIMTSVSAALPQLTPPPSLHLKVLPLALIVSRLAPPTLVFPYVGGDNNDDSNDDVNDLDNL